MAELGKQHFRTGHTWIASIASLVALVFSGYNFAQAQEDPRTVVTMPLTLRLNRDGEKVSVFVQPTIATRYDTGDVEMVTGMELRLRPPNAGPGPEFFWEDSVRWVATRDPKDYDTIGVWWQFESDPAPFMVTQEEPKQPVMRFSTHGWKDAPGRYDATLTVRRASTREPIERAFCLVMDSADITSLKKPGYDEYRRDVPGRHGGGCYHRYA
ncbi:hypothetical protein [Streptomyces sp. NPDC002602]|uniref:hypothetical protein n=1 Tax=Streptomyces sp. NPDC002602 TaxID=3364654 RepID=UPI0036C479BC